MADIPHRAFGRTGLEVTILGFGAMELRGAASEAKERLAAVGARPVH